MGPTVLDQPDVITKTGQETERDLPWNVVLYNDDHHSFDEVILQVQKATGASLQRAFDITMEAHTKGRAICFTGTLSDSERVAGILREIALTVEINRAE
jgi:ATP-dependent Clp protease adaptor protein ClpS